ncbi:MAG: hypothetical protein Q4B70_01120 [Lachnospiraceae bacterium]|nr:hypothetical protein [Lachnospiraceae bacterium]
MKKKDCILYIIICLLLCILPFAGMAVCPTKTTTENKVLAAWPSTVKDGKWNKDYFNEMGSYFEDHFAFRNLLVTADADIQSKLFKVSNVDTVTVGSEGWLYYTATLDDYLGQNVISEREAFNIANNLSLLKRYVEQQGARFLFTIAPNKNTLYGENMPYYNKKKVSNTNNMDLLLPYLTSEETSYVDLFQIFEAQKETLYLKRDSHWNQKGAVLAYDTLLDSLEMEHNTYETTKAIRTKTEYGDLNKMLYPLGAKPEWNYEYQYENQYSYITDTKSVEEDWIETENDSAEGSLLMFRDSFGNTLLPLMANAFSKGYFTKSVPYQIGSYMEEYQPELVIVEKVERNVEDFALSPPVMKGLETEMDISSLKNVKTATTLAVNEEESDSSYWKITGSIDRTAMNPESKISIALTAGGETKIYEAFTVTDENSDYGYALYMPKVELPYETVEAEIIVVTQEEMQSVFKEEIKLGGGE